LLSEECCIVIVILALVSATDVAAINLIIRKYAGENKVRGSGYRGWGIAAETSNEIEKRHYVAVMRLNENLRVVYALQTANFN
jgi:hypothetical protein